MTSAGGSSGSAVVAASLLLWLLMSLLPLPPLEHDTAVWDPYFLPVATGRRTTGSPVASLINANGNGAIPCIIQMVWMVCPFCPICLPCLASSLSTTPLSSLSLPAASTHAMWSVYLGRWLLHSVDLRVEVYPSLGVIQDPVALVVQRCVLKRRYSMVDSD